MDLDTRSARSWIPLALAGLVLGAVFAGARSAGADARLALWYLAFLTGHVWLPGLVLRSSLAVFDGGPCTTSFGAWILGAAFQCAGFFSTRALGCPALAPWLPLALLPLLLRPRVRRHLFDGGNAGAPAPAALLLGLGLCAAVVVRNLAFAPDAWGPLPESDPPFHAANAAELRNGWPLHDPRLAGTPLRYHVLAYCLAAGASEITRAPVWSTAYVLGNAIGPLLLVLGLCALGERCLSSRGAGCAAAVLVVLHEDLLAVLGKFAGVDLSSRSYLAYGVHSSPSACLSLAFLTAILIALHEWASAERVRAREVVLLLLWGAIESGTKGSAMPVLLAGLALAAGWELLRTRRFPARLAQAGVLLALGALPCSLWLVAGPDDYASAMLRWSPLATVYETPLSKWIAAHAGGAGELVALLAWPLAFLGLAALGAVGRGFERRTAWSGTERVLLGVALAGITAALVLRAPGSSQLFFAYNGQLALAGLAGAWIARRPRGLQLGLALLVLLGAARTTWTRLEERAAQRFVPGELDRAHRAGDDWMRTQLPADALLVVEVPAFLHSVYAEREVLIETEKYLPRTLARENGAPPAEAGPDDAIAQRIQLQARCIQRPTAENWRRLRKLVGGERPFFVVRERVASVAGGLPHAGTRPAGGAPCFEALFENEAVGVYRVREP